MEDLRFGWIIAGTLAGAAKPWPEALPWIVSQGVRAIVSATERPLDFVGGAGIDCLHLPVIDQRAPTFEQMDAFVAFVESRRRVLVHCAHGVGRTATFAASYIIHAKHRTAEQAINYIAANRFGWGKPGPTVATRVQEDALRRYERLCRERE